MDPPTVPQVMHLGHWEAYTKTSFVANIATRIAITYC